VTIIHYWAWNKGTTGFNDNNLILNQLGYLLIRLSEFWSCYRVFDWQKDVPWTNNVT
jgi:hypothetical protein